MRDQTDNETTKAAVAVEPYGDVALGVECAWPESIPALAVAEAFNDASISMR
jgi:hypothetical protein